MLEYSQQSEVWDVEVVVLLVEFGNGVQTRYHVAIRNAGQPIPLADDQGDHPRDAALLYRYDLAIHTIHTMKSA
jgi:hypothetical protein